MILKTHLLINYCHSERSEESYKSDQYDGQILRFAQNDKLLILLCLQLHDLLGQCFPFLLNFPKFGLFIVVRDLGFF